MVVLVYHLFSIAFLLACHLLSLFIFGGAKKPSVRWFFVHGVSNVVVACRTLPTLRSFVEADAASFERGVEDKLPILLTIYTHLYHMTFYRMTADDVLHHAVFLPTIALPGALYDWRNIGNVQLFFICGMPGAILYFVLVLQKTRGLVVDEPLVSALINALVRTPGILAANAFLFSLRRDMDVPAWALWSQLCLAPANALYYATISVRRCVSRRLKQKSSS